MNDVFNPNRKPLWLPQPMRIAPPLPAAPSSIDPHSILLINPFYPKDPRASFGKHVLTPTLALTSIAGATPASWSVSYWDENLLQGPPPCAPVPHVVGITVHLTFAQRPYELAAWYRRQAAIVADAQPYTVFVDNNLGSRPAYLRALCKALRPLEIIWSAAVTIDVTDDEALVREMALAGCTGVFVGFESLNESNLAAARKRTPPPIDYARRVALLHRYGIQVNGSFVLGFDHDGPDVFERTVAWIEANQLECATFHILT